MELFIDIETVPCQAQGIREDLAASIKPPATYKKAESIAEWEATEKPKAVEEAWLKTSFDGALGQIVCIGWAAHGEKPQALVADDLSRESEAEILRAFVQRFPTPTAGQRPRLVGHNIAMFDLPFMWKRFIVHGIKPPMWFPRNPKPWSDGVFDTMAQWDSKTNISMDRLAKCLGLPGKSGSGADVWPMAQEGRFSEIADYCKTDVCINRMIFERMTFMALGDWM